MIDAAFAVNKGLSSQLGVIVMLRDTADGRANVVHYSSTKSKRVCKSVLAAELFALVDGFDISKAIKDCVERATTRVGIPLTMCTDSHSLYGLCVSLSPTTEKRLLIDLALIRQAYESSEISKIVWIAGEVNPADDLTKVDKRNGTLAKLLTTNHFQPPPKAWIERDDPRSTTDNVIHLNVDENSVLVKQKVARVSHH